jgi:hypothetical protein
VLKELEATRERFSKAEQDYAKKHEDMKLSNMKRKKAMQSSDTEKQNYERLLKIPEENQVKQKQKYNIEIFGSLNLGKQKKLGRAMACFVLDAAVFFYIWHVCILLGMVYYGNAIVPA